MPIDIIDYSNTVFYKIYCNDTTVSDIYVGHTTNFVQRKYSHKKTCIKENYPNHHLKVYKCIREHGGWDNWKMDIIGFRDCYDHYEARKIEQKYFETLHATLNSIEPLPKPKPRPTAVPKEKLEKPVLHCDLCKTTCLTNKALIAHKETNKHKRNVDDNASNKTERTTSQKNPSTFICQTCNYNCNSNKDYNKHLLTAKHVRLSTTIEKIPEVPMRHLCECGKIYLHNSSLYKHKKKCNSVSNSASILENPVETSAMMEILSQNKELMNLLVLQNREHREETSKLQNTIHEMIQKNGQ